MKAASMEMTLTAFFAAGPAQKAVTDVYGYMIGIVAADGSVTFEFHKLSVEDLLAAVQDKYPEALVRWCYTENKQ